MLRILNEKSSHACLQCGEHLVSTHQLNLKTEVWKSLLPDKVYETQFCILCVCSELKRSLRVDDFHKSSEVTDPVFYLTQQWNEKYTELLDTVNRPKTDNFLEAVSLEAAHQVFRWRKTDKDKQIVDWVFLFGVLSGKCLNAYSLKDYDMAKHHAITACAALYNAYKVLESKSK